jgi:hypothetical protein
MGRLIPAVAATVPKRQLQGVSNRSRMRARETSCVTAVEDPAVAEEGQSQLRPVDDLAVDTRETMPHRSDTEDRRLRGNYGDGRLVHWARADLADSTPERIGADEVTRRAVAAARRAADLDVGFPSTERNRHKQRSQRRKGQKAARKRKRRA